ncbi:MAG: diaminopimelate decarboxylase [Rhodobacter sp.]|nr:diaminopimelate decarboxylase [Rhodobacter sp.]MCY4168622.1 diaminopimelate decarboxylase [Rhodobacter sp.]MCY4242136.1 diaminopimelate decarboxylase [Rhodobacter sp.]
MDHFHYRGGVLHAEDVPVPAVAASVGTPFYLYSVATLVRHFRLLDEGLDGLDHLVCYAVKANSNQAVLKVLARLGAGMDVVSGGEYLRARAAGVRNDRIVFSGVGKTRSEMELALSGGVRQVNLESEPEMELLSQVAASMGVTVPVAFRINPDVDAGTHDKISTGRAEDKFGIPAGRAPDAYRAAASLPGLKVVGLDMHIGSQLTDLAPYELAFRVIAELTARLRSDGHEISRLDLGGGLGIPYRRSDAALPPPAEFCDLIRATFGSLGCEIEIEPGRLIAGNAGILVTRLLYRKSGKDREFLILDSAMNDLVRPALYSSYHEIVPVAEPAPGEVERPFDLVGPVCESGDTFAKRRRMPPLAPGDLLAFRSAGAYCAVMASEYNTRPLVPEVMVHGDRFAVIRARPTFDEILGRDIVPEWL